MQIKIDTDIDDYYEKMGILSYSIPIDLTESFTNNDDNKSNNDKDFIFLIILISIFIIIILLIVFIILYFNVKKNNLNLKEKILSISFAKVETNDLEHSKKDEDSDSVFI